MRRDTDRTQGCRKQITFDLSQEKLRQYYPRIQSTKNPKFYKKAYADIQRFMKKNGFEHRQFSVYVSRERLTSAKIIVMMRLMAKEMPWLACCVNQIDVTNIGAQHSLMQALAGSTPDIPLEPSVAAISEAEVRPPLQAQLAAAQAEADCRNQARAVQHTETIHIKPDRER